MGPASEGPLFPDKLHFALFWAYICLFVNQGVLVTASKESDGSYAYNTTLLVLVTEAVKLGLAMVLYLREHHWSWDQLYGDVSAARRLAAYYLVPAGLYCLYNNLAYVNLAHFDPATYFLLLNFRTVTTGIIFQILFGKRLGGRQWAALIILTLGCVVKQVEFGALDSIRINLDRHLLLMIAQVLCSCFAGVYNEYLLKDTGAGVHLQVQNIFMYGNSIVMNALFMGWNGSLLSALQPEALVAMLQRPIVSAIALNNGVAGITTSLFLKNFNSILKTFAGAIELLLTAIVAWILFGVPINAQMLVAISLVSAAMWLYSTQPVHNKAPTISPSKGNKDKLLAEEDL